MKLVLSRTNTTFALNAALATVAFALNTAGALNFSAALLVASFLCSFATMKNSNIVHIFWQLGIVMFLFCPYLYQIIWNEVDYTSNSFLAITLIISSVFMRATDTKDFDVRRFQIRRFIGEAPQKAMLLGVISASLTILSLGTLFFIFIGLAILSIMLVDSRSVWGKMVYGLYAVHVLGYMVLFWTGGGRLRLLPVIFVPMLWLLMDWNKKFPAKAFIAGMTFLSVANSATRNLSEMKFSVGSDLYIGSNWSPYYLANDFLQLSWTRSVRLQEFLEQCVLLVGVWIPRSVWPDKPYGFGRLYVDDSGMRGVSDGHSIAATYAGEAIYFLGPYWMIGAAAQVLSIYVLLRVVSRAPGMFSLCTVMLAIFLHNFIWGGVASYGTRGIVGMLPMAATIAILTFLSRRTHYVRTPS